MGTSEARDKAERGSRELWLSAAYETLIGSGVDDVKIQPLGKRLDLSRTSFYWFFADREALLDALLDKWREKNTGNLVRQASAYAESITEAVLNVFDCWLDTELFDSAFEFAVRSWALRSNTVDDEIRRADDERIQALMRMFTRFGFHPTTSDVRARTIYLAQIGYVSTVSKEEVGIRSERIADYVEILTGVAVKPQELARFHARHPPVGRKERSGTRAA